jgi:hypothetical protein
MSMDTQQATPDYFMSSYNKRALLQRVLQSFVLKTICPPHFQLYFGLELLYSCCGHIAVKNDTWVEWILSR